MKPKCPICKMTLNVSDSGIVRHPHLNVIEVKVWCPRCTRYTLGKVIGVNDLEPRLEN